MTNVNTSKGEERIRGAIYIPSRAYNAYQMWRDYNPEEVERDLDYALKVNLNSLRTWFSYEFWLEDPEALKQNFNHFLQASSKRGIRILPSLFEKVGIQPTQEALEDQDPLTAVCVMSPSREIFENPERYNETKQYVQWYMEHFRDDERLLAIEVMNEPIEPMRLKFARAMLQAAGEQKGSLPLTIGCIDIEDYIYFLDLEIDILQHHMNFPSSVERVETRLQKLEKVAQVLDKPVWLTEWQRIREGGNGWGDNPVAGDEWQPNYAPYARLLESYSVGTFFWSLMVKPAYLPPQRKKGTINGLFHEDGAVWSLEDARAISGNPEFQAVERKEWPDWCKKIPETYLGNS
jgi:hypothetical protein